ncbi:MULTISPECIES: glutathione S-transferase N-terminal domain-containing protein [Sphingobium]|uniref:glutathione S-transferase N-terminal domain-containing protein n=1 Tax=Sphingobium TaxID=165695 RepID=UPI0015EC369D|nr:MULTISPECIES: glutathione S-transferase N-terminal domain-containing protein [Sphingobium]MCW2363104.1 GST-like protein [Sphingobium sp. B10D3B]MCW2400216.1 GST-like protein [Sphingobium sp. B10D7B]MCW2407194.1 GST-like protein [Sphingobium xanthum]
MPSLSEMEITRRWPAEHPDRIQLYSVPTPNGVKVSIMLEETGLPYEAHLVAFSTDEQKSPEFLSISPNGKIPAIVDPSGPGGAPIALFESGAILLYLAEKTGQFMPTDASGRWEALQWLMFQVGGVGPMVGQLGFFHKFAGKDWEDKRPRDRYAAETARLLSVMNTRLADREWLLGKDYSIVDISLLGWIRNIVGLFDAAELVDFGSMPHVARWLEQGLARPAVQRGLTMPPRPS